MRALFPVLAMLVTAVLWMRPACFRSDPERAAILRNLKETRITLKVRDAQFIDVLEYLRECSGLPLILDAEVRDTITPEPRISVSVRNLPLGAALAAVLNAEGSGYSYRVTEERVVLLSRY
jgi:hypothetical protein